MALVVAACALVIHRLQLPAEIAGRDALQPRVEGLLRRVQVLDEKRRYRQPPAAKMCTAMRSQMLDSLSTP